MRSIRVSALNWKKNVHILNSAEMLRVKGGGDEGEPVSTGNDGDGDDDGNRTTDIIIEDLNVE